MSQIYLPVLHFGHHVMSASKKCCPCMTKSSQLVCLYGVSDWFDNNYSYIFRHCVLHIASLLVTPDQQYIRLLCIYIEIAYDSIPRETAWRCAR